ncbi:MAG: hypothetical protein II194_02970 [Bacteroidales bacterium]|nr:hypothetical protein [Bacteroidales bacterium]
MKINFWKSAVLLAAIMGLTSCEEELKSPESMIPEGVPVYTAYTDGADTKTVLEGVKSLWAKGDAITVHNGSKGFKFTSSLTSASAKADFYYDGKDYSSTGSVIAVYPYDATCAADPGARTLVKRLDPWHQVVSGSYNPNAAVAVAYSENSTLQFRNAVALLKFTVKNSNITHVLFSGNDSEPVAGDLKITLNEDGSIRSVVPQQTTIGGKTSYCTYAELYAYKSDSDKHFKEGETYYMAVAPQTFNKGYSVKIRVNDGAEKVVKTYTKGKAELKAGVIYDMGEVGYAAQESGLTTLYLKPNSNWKADNARFAAYFFGDGDTWVSMTGPDSEGIYKCSIPSGSDYTHVIFCRMNPSETANNWDNKWNQTLDLDLSEVKADENCYKVAPGSWDKGNGEWMSRNEAAEGYVTVEKSMPSGLEHGINYNADGTVTLVLYDKDKNGKSYKYCSLLWDGNEWGNDLMYWDKSKYCWWITLSGLDPDRIYKFQYGLGNGEPGEVKIFDPYTELLFDTDNDQWISDYNYPDLDAEYGESYNAAYGRVSTFQVNQDEYNWQISDYDIENADNLVIYELLFRDFTDNAYGEGSVKAAIGKLDYLKNLGVTAVELMPIQEFDGNDSWGYGTHAYFAMDKAYGTRNDYKQFIDECHKRDMAVILDVVYNHATGENPMAKMYWYGDAPASNNPWFNVTSPHGWSVFHDWNHSSAEVRNFIKRNLTYLMEEYKFDGFRFDLTKGFTQNSGKEDSYDQSRVDYLKEYNSHIKSVDPEAVMICEHFVDEENWELGWAGIKVWRNMNKAFCQSQMGWSSDSDFTSLAYQYNTGSSQISTNFPFGTLVGYMESHDEERTNYKTQNYGTSTAKTFAVRLKRAGLNAAFCFLAPGPKMIWQYGELGYDYSKFYDWDSKTTKEGDDMVKTKKKPYVADSYFSNSSRKALYDTYAMILNFRKDNPSFFRSDADFQWYVSTSHWPGRYMFCKDANGKRFAVFGNFGSGSQTISVDLPAGGTWYQYDNGAEWEGAKHSVPMSEGQFYILVNDKSLCLK